jgi:ABC-2 type transport system ATP-binding protein
MSEQAIFTEGLSKSFGAQAAVTELNLQIQPGAVYGFLGRNGAGKTTTMPCQAIYFLSETGLTGRSAD